MADNYLEKKYEEYKSRKEGRTNHPYNGYPQNQESLCNRRCGRYRQSDRKSFPFRRTPRGVLRP